MGHTRLSRTITFCLSAAAAIGAVLLLSAPASGSLISGVGTADQVATGPYTGWYVYTYTVTWNLSKGLSHVDLTLPVGGLTGDMNFAFAAGTDGQSTKSGYHSGDTPIYSVMYDASFQPRGDPSISFTTPVLKWEPVSGGSPGKVGVGAFWFYSDATPLTGMFDNVLVAKNGTHKTFGDLTGAYPSSATMQPQVVPEPATMAYLLVGAGLTWMARRRERRAARSKAVAR